MGQVTFSDKALIERHSIPEPNTVCHYGGDMENGLTVEVIRGTVPNLGSGYGYGSGSGYGYGSGDGYG